MEENKTAPAARPDGEIPPSFGYDEIALRAYFIGLARIKIGETSSPMRDWLDAESQLIEERKPAPLSA